MNHFASYSVNTCMRLWTCTLVHSFRRIEMSLINSYFVFIYQQYWCQMWILSMEKCLEADKTFCLIVSLLFILYFWILSTKCCFFTCNNFNKACLVFNHKMCLCFKMWLTEFLLGLTLFDFTLQKWNIERRFKKEGVVFILFTLEDNTGFVFFNSFYWVSLSNTNIFFLQITLQIHIYTHLVKWNE